MLIKVRIVTPILPGELKGQMRRMSLEVAKIRERSGSAEIIGEEEMSLSIPTVPRPRGRRKSTAR